MVAKRKDTCRGWERGALLINTGLMSTGKHPRELFVCPECGRAVQKITTGRAADHRPGTRAQRMQADLAYAGLRDQRAGRPGGGTATAAH